MYNQHTLRADFFGGLVCWEIFLGTNFYGGGLMGEIGDFFAKRLRTLSFS